MVNINDYTTVMTTIYREQIEAGDIKVVLDILESVGLLELEFAELETLERLQSQIGLFIDGYNDDSRELWEIPEVRSYFQNLHSVWPYGLWFFNRQTATLQLLVLCHINPTLKPNTKSGESTLSISCAQVSDFLSASAPATFSIPARLEWPQERTMEFYCGIAAIFGVTG
jgi:hypothetical protein